MRAITPVQKTKAGVKGVDKLQANLDYKQTLKPLKGEKKPRYLKGEVDMNYLFIIHYKLNMH